MIVSLLMIDFYLNFTVEDKVEIIFLKAATHMYLLITNWLFPYLLNMKIGGNTYPELKVMLSVGMSLSNYD